jgi:Co/Zn/Cd efflux system component
VLRTVAFLNAAITTVQIIFAVSISSIALLADGLQMAIDTLTFLVGLYAESKRLDPKRGKAIELMAVIFSLVALFSVSSYVVLESVTALKELGDEEVDMRVVLTFACIGLLFDAIEVSLFVSNLSHEHEHEHEQVSGNSSLDKSFLLDSEGSSVERSNVSDGKLNMRAAFLHVGGDTLRSTSTLVTSLAVIIGGFNSREADAYCALIICVTLFVGGLCLCPTIIDRYVELKEASSANDNHNKQYVEMSSLEMSPASNL